MPKSVLDAIKEGHWDFEPVAMDSDDFDETDALPGSREKLAVMAERIKQGVPLWHPADRCDCEGLFERNGRH